mmetsp:Transcript_42332/g.123962  ORF Transcript_42332/g.123962 Transcript_42332/m.123962 type:complete len:428 (+) Transcript_42332:775-2058(+)
MASRCGQGASKVRHARRRGCRVHASGFAASITAASILWSSALCGVRPNPAKQLAVRRTNPPGPAQALRIHSSPTARIPCVAPGRVLSSPDVLLGRLSSHLASARALSPSLAAAPPLLVVDPAAGEGNYTQHLPDGMGRSPTLQLVQRHAWQAALAEPAPPTFGWLRSNFESAGDGALPRGVQLRQMGLVATPPNASTPSEVWVLEADVPELRGAPLPAVSRQRLQWATSVDPKVPRGFRRDYWQVDHLAGGPLREALQQVNASAAAAYAACLQQHKRPSACFGTRVVRHRTSLVEWPTLLSALGVSAARHIDLLVMDVRDASVDPLLRAFPFDRIRPTFIYYRHPKDRGKPTAALRSYLMGLGYSTSAHWETSAWGELNLAWRSDRCFEPIAGMPGRPLWWSERPSEPPASRRRGPRRARRRGAPSG